MIELTDEDTALRWHLSHNHYPALPLTLLPVAKAAIEAGREDDFDRLIKLPGGITWRGGRSSVEAGKLIETMHLDSFLGG